MDNPIRSFFNKLHEKRAMQEQMEKALSEGRLAFSNDKRHSENPYQNINEALESKWSEGWNLGKDAREVKISTNGWGKYIYIFILCGILLIPAMSSDSQNKKRRASFTWNSIVIPEKYGYLSGLINFDTLEIAQKVILIKKHSVFADNNVTLPIQQIKKIVFGTFVGQKYIRFDYNDDWFGGSYKIYINSDDTNDAIISRFDNSQIIVENQWN